MRDEIRSRWEKQDLRDKNRAGQFQNCAFTVGHACGRGKHTAQQKVNEQKQRFLELFDRPETEHRSELDVYQIGKYLQREYRLSLYTNDMQEICSNTCFTLNPDSALPVKESAISLSTADNNPGYP